MVKPLFVHIPKNGGTSIRQALYDQWSIYNDGLTNFVNGHWTQYQLESRARHAQYDYDYLFCVIREPLRRAKSVISHIKTKFIQQYGNHPYSKSSDDELVEQLFGYSEYRQKNNFDFHYLLLHQKSYIGNKNMIIYNMNNLKQLENDLKITIPHVNQTMSSNVNLSTSSIRTIENYFDVDFTLWESL